MADFDFDELDKAVAGAIGTNPSEDDSRSESSTAPSTSTEMPTSSESDSASNSASASTETPKITGISSPASKPVGGAPAVRRSSGRFMDMVHPKSDMRAGGSVRPSITNGAPTNSDTPSVAPEPAPSNTASDTPTTDEAAKPLESPFLPDAKVEKRPLGGFRNSKANKPELIEEPDEPRLEAPDDPRLEGDTMPDPIDFAIENGHVDPVEDTQTPEQIKEEEKTLETLDREPEPTDEPAEHDEPDAFAHPEDTPVESHEAEPTEPTELESPAPEVNTQDTEPIPLPHDAPVGPTSITQQYKEQQSETGEPGAIYDTEAYHQPLMQPAKKKSGFWVVFWILLILVVGGAAGAGFYLYILPML